MVIVLTVRDNAAEKSIKGHVSRPNRPTPDQDLAWCLMLNDINFLAFAKAAR
jgi:hypothetical protein